MNYSKGDIGTYIPIEQSQHVSIATYFVGGLSVPAIMSTISCLIPNMSLVIDTAAVK